MMLGKYFKVFFEIAIFFLPFRRSCTSRHPRSRTAACGVDNLALCILTAFSSPTIDFSARSS